MMITINLATIFSVLAILLSAACLAAVAALYRHVERLRARCHCVEANFSALQREVELMASVSAQTGSRVNRMENDYSGVAERVDQVELRRAPQSFDMAIDFARRGGDATQLAQRFGLSRGEAELVARMHGAKKRA